VVKLYFLLGNISYFQSCNVSLSSLLFKSLRVRTQLYLIDIFDLVNELFCSWRCLGTRAIKLFDIECEPSQSLDLWYEQDKSTLVLFQYMVFSFTMW